MPGRQASHRPRRTVRLCLALFLSAPALAGCDADSGPTAPDTSSRLALDVLPGVVTIAAARTEARVDVARSGEETVHMRFQAKLEGLPDLAASDVVATWEQAGGIDPVPFVVAIPAACFVTSRTGLRVNGFRTCGIKALMDGRAVPLLAFDAGLSPDGRDGVILRIQAAMGATPDDSAPVLLGALGGSELEIAVGSAIAGAQPLRAETVSGVEPSPFLNGASLAVSDARTAALAGVTAAGAEFVRLRFETGLGSLPALGRSDVVVTWEQAGGVEPVPFVVAIPAACFVSGRTGLRVDDFRTCGVNASHGDRAVPLLAFEAAVSPDGLGGAILRIQAVMSGTPDDSAPVLLGALGGAVLEIALGGAAGSALPSSVETVAGVPPDPI